MLSNVCSRCVCIVLNNDYLNVVKLNAHVISSCFLLCVYVVFYLVPSNCFLPWWNTPQSIPKNKGKSHNFTTSIHYLINHFPNKVLKTLNEEKKLFKIPIPYYPSMQEIIYTWYQRYDATISLTMIEKCNRYTMVSYIWIIEDVEIGFPLPGDIGQHTPSPKVAGGIM
jgi:hypothetical protein